MMLSKILKRLGCIAACATAAFLGAVPDASATLPAAESDILLCFRATGGLGANTDYMVNLGPVSQFTSAGVINVAIPGNISADLEAIYGEEWHLRADVVWSVSGVQKVAGNGFPSNTMFASRAQLSPGTQSDGWMRPSAFGAGAPALKMLAMRDPGFTAGTRDDQTQVESGNSSAALVQSVNAPNSYASYMPGGSNTTGLSAFGYFNAAGGIEATFANGPALSVVDFYKLEPGTGPAVLLGGFRLSDTAQLTFSSDISFFAGPALVKFSAESYPVSEDAAGGSVTLTVERSGNTDAAFTLNFSTTDGTAIAGTDYVAQTNTPVAFGPGETSKTVNVAVMSRAGFQGDRSFTASLSVATGAPQLIAPTTATINILETTPQPAILALSAAAYSVTENIGSGVVTLTINRSGLTTSATSVKLSTQDGTAVSAVDYTGQTGTVVNFDAGQTSQTVDVAITDRAGFQGNRAFNVELSEPANGAELGSPSTATVTIQENAPNPAGLVAFSSNAFNLTAGGPNLATVVLNRTEGTTGAITVDVSIALGGSLTPGEDFTFTSPTTVTFAEGQATATVDIALSPAASPLPGTFNLQLTNATGGASIGTPSGATVTISPAVPFAPQGIYTGLVTPTAATPPGGNLHNASGLLSVKVTPTGAFSGKVLIGGATVPIRGMFENNQARFKPALAPTVLIATKGKTPVVIGELSLSISAGKVSGAIGAIATIDADRAGFDGKTAATTPDAYYLANKGKYTAALPAKAQAALLAAQFPQGDGVGKITITKQGKLTFKGKLADGTPVSMSSPLSADLEAALYVALYAKKGSIAGNVALDKTAADSDVEGTDFLWLRPAIAKAKHYPAGWPAGVKVDLVGTRYAVPVAASVLLDLGAEDLANGNATFQAEDGKLQDDQQNPIVILKNVSISPKNKVTNVPATDKTFKVTIAAPTGAISGLFTHTDGTKPKINGIILQKGTNQGGFGYFLSTVPRGGPSGESGGISLTAK